MTQTFALTLWLYAAQALCATPGLVPHVYPVADYRVVDGDTIVTRLDLGWGTTNHGAARVNGIDAPEMDTEAGRKVEEFVTAWCKRRVDLKVIYLGRGKFAGRYAARVIGDGRDLGEELLDSGMVREYDGGRRKEWGNNELYWKGRCAKYKLNELKRDEGGE